jgi:hypothetical protein
MARSMATSTIRSHVLCMCGTVPEHARQYKHSRMTSLDKPAVRPLLAGIARNVPAGAMVGINQIADAEIRGRPRVPADSVWSCQLLGTGRQFTTTLMVGRAASVVG